MNPSFDGRVFLETTSLFAAASLGQLVEGYAVVFGEKDQISLKSLKDIYRKEFVAFARVVQQRVERRYGPTVMFEHGASCAETKVSCGVNRIHIHIVPYAGCLLKDELGKRFQCKSSATRLEYLLKSLESWKKTAPYFWIEDRTGAYLFSYGERRESQVVRRIIAQQVGEGACWDWREYPTEELARKVARDLLNDAKEPSLDGLYSARV